MSNVIGPRLLDKTNIDYIKTQLETGDPSRSKKILQRLCKLYRNGYRIGMPQLVGVEQSIVGLLYTQGNDEKVRRWALNALARLGREPTCIEAIVQVLKNHSHEPQTTAAAIAAIYRMSRRASQILKALSFDEQMITLAALQHVDKSKLDLSSLPLNADTASPDLLRLALVLIGLDRAPPNLLNPKHDNARMVKALGGHHDNIVSQYSVWAITENDSLGIPDLGLDLRTVEQQPSNVRSWIFQLIAMSAVDAKRYMEYLELGTGDPDSEARYGLALGLRETFFDGLEVLVLDWYTTEDDTDIRQCLMDHIIRQGRHCQTYEAIAIEEYEKEPRASSARQRMAAAAAGTPLYTKFRKLDFDGTPDLFRGDGSVTNNTFNISGGIQGGSISLGGDAENSGSISIHYNSQTIEGLQSQLSMAERELHSIECDPNLKKEAIERVQSAKADPTPDNLTRALTFLKKVEAIATTTANTKTAIGTIASAIGSLAGLS